MLAALAEAGAAAAAAAALQLLGAAFAEAPAAIEPSDVLLSSKFSQEQQIKTRTATRRCRGA
jgi:hypothetical protein